MEKGYQYEEKNKNQGSYNLKCFMSKKTFMNIPSGYYAQFGFIVALHGEKCRYRREKMGDEHNLQREVSYMSRAACVGSNGLCIECIKTERCHSSH